jgi:hypothetical protein
LGHFCDGETFWFLHYEICQGLMVLESNLDSSPAMTKVKQIQLELAKDKEDNADLSSFL